MAFYEREAVRIETLDPYHSASLEAQGFVKIDDTGAAPEQPEAKPVSKMTVAELTEFAEAEGIDLGEATKKADILAVIEGGKAEEGKTEGDDLLGDDAGSDDDPL